MASGELGEGPSKGGVGELARPASPSPSLSCNVCSTCLRASALFSPSEVSFWSPLSQLANVFLQPPAPPVLWFVSITLL